jgi:hypothetical protein
MRRTLHQLRASLESAMHSGEVAALISRRARIALYFTRLAVRIVKQWLRP